MDLLPFARIARHTPNLPPDLVAALEADARAPADQAAAAWSLLLRHMAAWLEVVPETAAAAASLRAGARIRAPYEIRRRMTQPGDEPPWDWDAESMARGLSPSCDPAVHAQAFDLVREAGMVGLLSASYGRAAREERRRVYPPVFHLVLAAVALALARGIDLAPVRQRMIEDLRSLARQSSRIGMTT